MDEEVVKDFKGIWISKDIWFDKNLSVMEKYFFAEITSLAGVSRGCYASNQHFTKILSISTARVSQLIKSLTDKKYIMVKLFYQKGTKRVNRREIHVIKSYPLKKHRNNIDLSEIESIDDTKRDFKGVWIPRDLLFDKELNKLQMATLIEIDSLSYGDLGCFASNKHFADFLNIKSSRASQLISDLKHKKYIETKLFFNPDNSKQIIKREIYLLNKLNGVLNKFDAPTYKIKYPYLEKYKEREPIIENQLRKDNVEQARPPIQYQNIINFFNDKTKKHFRCTDNNKKLIKNLFGQGYEENDIKQAIVNQSREWLQKASMTKYLRPSTIFGTKFDEYLNNIQVESERNKEIATDWDKYKSDSISNNSIEAENEQAKLMDRLKSIRSKNK